MGGLGAVVIEPVVVVLDENGSMPTLGQEFELPTPAGDYQYSPQMLALTNGNFLVSWSDGGGLDIDGNPFPAGSSGFKRRAQIFDGDGNPVGSQFFLHDNTTGMDPLFELPLFAMDDGGFYSAREIDGSIEIRTYGANGALASSTSATITSDASGSPTILEVVPGADSESFFVIYRVDVTLPTGHRYAGSLGHTFYAQAVSHTGDETGEAINLGSSIGGSPPEVFTNGTDIYAMLSVPNTVGDYQLSRIDLATGELIAQSTTQLDPGIGLGYAPEFSHFNESGDIVFACRHFESDVDDKFVLTREGLSVITFSNSSLDPVDYTVAIESSTPGGYAVREAYLIELPHGQYLAVFQDWDTFQGQLLNADMSLSGESFDLSVRDGLNHLFSSGHYIGDGKVVLTWDYSTGVGYEGPVARILQLNYAGHDVLRGTDAADQIHGQVGDDNIHGGRGADHLYGDEGNDRVYSGKGSDKVYLGDGDDYVRVGGGEEEFHGGAGKDYISYYDSTGGVTINLATNEVSGSWASNDTISGFESVSGSKTGGDKVYGTSGSNTIKTYGGNDKVYAGKGSDKVYLGDGDDYVKAGGGEEEFHGGAGKDYISYYDSTGGVTINLATNEVSGSWASNDTISGFESVSGSKTGGDKIYGTSGANTIKTYGGNDKVYAGKGSDKVYLGDGNDYVRAGGGQEYFNGGAGSDYISYFDSTGGITIDLQANTVSGSWAANDTVKYFESVSGSGTGSDKMYGNTFANTLKGFGGDDKLYGRSGDDKLYGGDGKDRFDGGAGTDLLYGGADADTFHFDHGEDHDIIKDFENNIDVIQLDNFGFGSADEAFSFAAQAGDDVVFDFGGGDMLTVENATIGQLYNDLELV